MLSFLGTAAFAVVWGLFILFMNWKHNWKISQIVAGMLLMAALTLPFPGLVPAIDRSGNDVLNSINK